MFLSRFELKKTFQKWIQLSGRLCLNERGAKLFPSFDD